MGTVLFEYCNCSHEVRNQELYNAAANGSLDEVTKLLKQGADPNYQPFYGKWTPLHAACANNHPMVVKALVKNKANVSARDRIEYTPLHVACMYGYMGCVGEFDQFKDVDASSEFSVAMKVCMDFTDLFPLLPMFQLSLTHFN